MARTEGPPVRDIDVAVETILADLRAEGGRVTTGRRAIVRSLLGARDHHVTADELVALVQADHPDVHRSTVYRTLDALEGLGVVHRIPQGAGGAIYHLVDHDHHHLMCTRCGAVTEAPAGLFAPIAERLEVLTGFVLDRSHITISGLCARCRAAGPPGATEVAHPG
jgi:Fur family transcriptional regulator, ferric uptake regulator